MLSFQGIGATNGKGSGIAIIHKKTSVKTHDKYFELEAKEVFFEIRELALAELQSLIDLCKECEEKDILIAHQMMMNDIEVEKEIFHELDNNVDLAKAIKNVKSKYYDQFSNMENEVFKSKALDIEDVFERLLLALKKQNKFKAINKNFILICDDLLPTTIYDYPQEFLRGIVVKKGSMFAHGIIIAKSKNIPVVIGLGADINKIHQSDYLVVDGLSGKVVLISE